ncbi:MAG: peptidylprolyl isomerase [Oceanococcaceae bacterium]
MSLSLSAQPRPVDYIVAKVNDDVILASELVGTYATLAQQYAAQGNPLPPLEEIERQLLDRMILNRVQLQRAEQTGLDVSDAELDAAMNELASRNGLSLNAFARELRSQGLSYLDIRRQVREDLLLNRLRSREVESRVAVSERDVDMALSQGLADEGTEYLLSHILVAVADDADPAQRAAGLAEAEALRAEHADGRAFRELAIAHSAASTALEGGTLGWRKGTELPSIVATVAPQLNVGAVSAPLAGPGGWHLFKLDDKRSSAGPQTLVPEVRARHILLRPNPLRSDQQTQDALRALRAQIRDGADFAELVKANSEDPGSVNQGGDLGWQPAGSFDPAFQQALDALKPGELSPVFRSSFGWHVAEVLDRRERDRTEDMRRVQVRRAIFRRKVGEEFETWARRLRDEAFVEYQPNPSSA